MTQFAPAEPLTRPRSSSSTGGGRRYRVACALLVLALMGWGLMAELDVVSNAVGEIVPAGRVKAVQHLEGGIVSEILLDEGSMVTKGQPLIRLDPIRAQAEYEELAKRLIGLRIDILRLTAEVEGRDQPGFSPDLENGAPDLVAAARGLFGIRKRRVSHDSKALDDLVEQRQSEIAELSLRLRNNRKSLEILSSQVTISENMLGRDLTSRMSHLEYLRQQQTLRTQVEADQAAQPRLNSALEEARERLASLHETVAEQTRKELALAQQQFDELSQRLLKFRNIQDRTVLRAPVDGIVKSLNVTTEGAVIQPGQIVAEIVPVEGRLIIEAKLPLQDIGYVHPGQKVRITLSTPEAAVFGSIAGTVERVSPDSIATANSRAYYKVRIETAEDHFESARHSYRLYPGMQVLCGIQLGSRTVFEYLLSPWFHTLRFAFQER